MHRRGYWDNTLVCEGGHVQTAELDREPEWKNLIGCACEQCGKTLITACPGCNSPIRGKHIVETTWSTQVNYVISTSRPVTKTSVPETYVLPAYCPQCRSPYPWTASILQAANNAVDIMDELTDDEKSVLKANTPSLLVDSPQSGPAASVVSKILNKVGEISKEAFKKAIADVASDFIKSVLFR